MNVAYPVSQLSEEGAPQYRAFFEELRRLGHIEGNTIIVERWSADGREESFGELARNVVQSKPDIIFAASARFLKLLKAETSDIPIVAFSADPVGNGLADSLAHPGGNITGVTSAPGAGLVAKQLEFLRELSPGISRIAHLASRDAQAATSGNALRTEAKRTGASVIAAAVDSPAEDAEYRRFFATAARDQADALVAADTVENFRKVELIVELARMHRLPAIYPHDLYVRSGGLVSYGHDPLDSYRRAAGYVHEISKGVKAGDLPFYQPTRLFLTLNLNGAQELGLAVPASFLARADTVIE